MLKRIQDKPSSILTDQFALALGGIAVVSRNPQILYCRDTFDHPTLIENESICDEFGESFFFLPDTCACVPSCFQFFWRAVMGNGAHFHKPHVLPHPSHPPHYCSIRCHCLLHSLCLPWVRDDYLEFVVQCSLKFLGRPWNWTLGQEAFMLVLSQKALSIHVLFYLTSHSLFIVIRYYKMHQW